MPSLRLRSVAGARRGQEFVFSGPRVRIGRSRDNDLILPDRTAPLTSGHHAEALLDTDGSWSIVDLESSNGTRLNSVAVHRHPLKNGDRLTFGDETFTVAVGDSGRGRLWAAAATAAALALVGAIFIVRELRPVSFEEVAVAAAPSVFMIAIDEGGRRTIVGTGFAVGADGALATNAHVVDALRKRGVLPGRRDGATVVAVLGDTYAARRVVAGTLHPDWREGSMHADVGLLQLEPGPPLTPLPLAGAAAIAALRRGASVAAFGFPAVSTDPARPRARVSVDVVGDIRDEYFEVGLGIAPGTSGSPVFDRRGQVVAIVVGGDFVDGPGGPRPSGSAANWAISAAVVRDFAATRP